jgi:glycine hydroxymethyltransferase
MSRLVLSDPGWLFRQPGFADYAGSIVANPRALAEGLARRGAHVITRRSDNHLVLIDVAAGGRN